MAKVTTSLTKIASDTFEFPGSIRNDQLNPVEIRYAYILKFPFNSTIKNKLIK